MSTTRSIVTPMIISGIIDSLFSIFFDRVLLFFSAHTEYSGLLWGVGTLCITTLVFGVWYRSNLPLSVKKVVIRHSSLNIPKIINKSESFILLHAAFYPQYSLNDSYSIAIRSALHKNSSLKMKAITTDSKATWAKEFAKCLRNEYGSLEQFNKAIEASNVFFKQIATEHPQNVELVYSAALPFCPIVVIDDNLFVGSYAHSHIIAPEGYWLHIKNKKIPQLYQSLLANTIVFEKLSCEEKALVRYLEEFNFAFKYNQTHLTP